MTDKSKELISQVNDQIEYLARLTDEAARSKEMIAFLETCAKFYNYSLNNLWLIMFQKPEASQVAGYMAWKEKFNRQVKKGEHGITILAPAKYRQCNLKPTDPDYNPESKSYVIKGFRAVTVFDISQTEGEELPDAPTWQSTGQNEEIAARLIAYAEEQNIKVEITEDVIPGALGSSEGGKIKIRPGQSTQVIAHEIAHELLHKAADRWTMTKEEKELEAESVAFVVCYTLGIKDLASPNYLALWSADANKIREKAERIRETALQIIKGVS